MSSTDSSSNPPVIKSPANSPYRDLLASLVAREASYGETCTELCSAAIAEAEKKHSTTPLAALFQLASSRYIGLSNLLLERVQEHGGEAMRLMARYLFRMKPGISEPSPVQAEAWGRAYWAAASDEEKLCHLSSTANPDPHQWVIELWVEIIDASTNPALIKEAGRHVSGQLSADRINATVLVGISARLATWLKSSIPEKVNTALVLCTNELVYTPGDAAAETAMALLDILETRQQWSKEAEQMVLRTAKAIRQGSVGGQRSGALLERLMKSRLAPQNMRTILRLLLGEEFHDYTKQLKPEIRPAFIRWLSKTVLATGLEIDPNIYACWICMDSQTTAQLRNSLLPRMQDRLDVAAMAARHWPTEAIPDLVNQFKGLPDAVFLPLLAIVVQGHKGVVSPEIFERLTQSPNGRYRALATVALEAVALEAIEEPAVEPKPSETILSDATGRTKASYAP